MVVRKILLAAVLFAVSSWAANVSYPSAPVPSARFATGITYDYLGGYFYKAPIEDLPFSMHGVNAFFTYAPVTYVNFGVDLGMRDVNIPNGDHDYGFNGKLGIAAGSHLKLATPYFGDVMGIIAMCRGLWFHSKDDNDSFYSGPELTGAGGLSFHVKRFGYISFGCKYFEIFGENGIGDGDWSNDATVGGWASFDYFPKTNVKKYIPFISFEFAFFPSDNPFYGGSPIVRNASFAVTIGAITHRIYGDDNRNWRP